MASLHSEGPLTRHPMIPLVVPLAALLVGQAVAAAPGLGGVWPFTMFLAAVSLALCLVRPRWGLLGLACALAFHWGFAAHHSLLHPHSSPGDVRHLARTETVIEGRLYREPEGRGSWSRWYLSAERVWTPEGLRRTSGNVLVTVRNAYRHWHYGDVVRVPLRLRPPRNRGERFDYRAFLARRGIYRVAYLHNDWEAVRVSRGGGVRGWIETARRRIGRFVERRFEPESGALVKALMLGDRGGLSRETRERFAAVGMSHVLSISGLHVGMLGLAVFVFLRTVASRSTRLLLSLPVYKLAAFGSLVPVVLYTVVAGARIPTVRAAIMIGLYQLAVLSGRQANIFGTLAWAAAIAALCWPGAVMEVSFQLSFLAVLAIVAALRLFRHAPFMRSADSPAGGWLQRLRPSVLLAILVPFFAGVGTGPLVAHHFGYLSLAGFVANPLLVPLVGFLIVPAALLMGFLCLLFPAASTLLAWVLEPFVALFLRAVELLAGFPMAALSVPRPDWPMVGIIYLAILTAAACARGVLRKASRKGLC